MSSNTMSGPTDNLANNLLASHGKPLSKEETAFLTHLAQWPISWGDGISALLIQRSLSKHAEALNGAATASDRYSKSLAYATWALVAVTVALVGMGVIQVLVLRHP